jgi:hypothetical protein
MTAGFRFTQSGWRRVLLQVGEGNLTGKLVVDQVYAKYQHERTDLRHPRGGGAHYLRDSFQARYANYLRRVAKAFLDGDPEQAMAECMEDLNGAMSAATPVLYNNLRRSGNPQVHSRGRKVYDRKPQQRRLTSAELKLLRRGGRRRR